LADRLLQVLRPQGDNEPLGLREKELSEAQP
jgi:hypothetical protein